MSDYINNHLYLNDNENWSKATKNFSDNSINSLFDVDHDGTVSKVEMDRAESIGLLNTLNSINPLLARSYNDINLSIITGSYLTTNQINNSKLFYNALQKAIILDEQDTIIKHNINPEEPNEYKPQYELNLSDDIKQRQYLTQAEINNDP